MDNKNEIFKIIYESIDEINQINELNIERNKDTKLIGKESTLDSLGLVNLIVGIEENIADKFKIVISLTDEKAMSQKNSPFLSVNSLADFIEKRIAEEHAK